MADEPAVIPGPDTSSAPAIMLSGGMQGGVPDMGTAPLPNVQQADAMQGGPPQMTAPLPNVQQADATQPNVEQTAPGNPANDPEMVAAGVHHGRIGRAIDAVTKALGGSQTMHVVQQQDGSFIAQPMDSTPGERWSRIARAALSGAAAGFAHGQGPGGMAKAFSAGAQTGLALPQQQQDQTMKKADDLETQRQKQIMFKKNMALLDIQQARANLDLMQSPQKFAAEQQEYADKREAGIIKQHGVYLATYANGKDLSDHMQTNQDLLDAHVGKGAQLDQVPVYDSSGKQVGVKIYGIPQDTLNQYNADPENILVEKMSPDNKSIETSYRSYKPGQSLNSDILADRKKQDTDNQAVHLNFAKLQNETTQAAAAKQKADTDQKESASRIALNYAKAAADRDNVKTPKQTGYVDPGTGIPYVFGKDGKAEPMQLPEGMTAIRPQDLETFRTKTQNPALKGEEAYNMLKTFDANMKAGIKNPIEQRVALQMALQTASGMAPSGTGGVSGRSNAALTSAMHDRGLADDKINLINRLIDGQVVTQTQMDNALRTVNAYRRGLWREAATIGAASHMKPEDVIPATVLKRDEIINEIYGRPAQTQPQTPGQQQQQPQVQPIPQPPTATMKVPGKSDGYLHWSDGKNDLGIAGPIPKEAQSQQ